MASRDVRLLLPTLQPKVEVVIDLYGKVDPRYELKVISTYRPPEDQNRSFNHPKGGVPTTTKDGYRNPSMHNFMRAAAFDVGVFFKETGGYLSKREHGVLYRPIEAICVQEKLLWGGWTHPVIDAGHVSLRPYDFVKLYQEMLEFVEYDVGRHGPNGIHGRDTKSSLVRFQLDHKLKVSGWMDVPTFNLLHDTAFPGWRELTGVSMKMENAPDRL